MTRRPTLQALGLVGIGGELAERLPPRERTVLVLHYGHGYRLEEIAILLDLTHTNVRSIIARLVGDLPLRGKADQEVHEREQHGAPSGRGERMLPVAQTTNRGN